MEKNNRSPVPPHIRELKAYQPGKTIAEVQRAYRPDRISKLASNENRMGCSPTVKEAVGRSLNEIQDYPDPLARDLRREIALRNGIEEEQIVLAAGSESLIANLCRTYFLEGEHAITADTTFVGFFVQAAMENVPVKRFPLTSDYRFDLPAIAAAIAPQTKMIYIANPNNPTGTYVTRREFSRFMEQVPGDVLVVLDEAYYEYAAGVEDYPCGLNYPNDNLLVLRTFSKAYGLAGFRVGYGMGKRSLIAMMRKTKLTFEPNSAGQAAALAAYRDNDFLERSRQTVDMGRRRLCALLDGEGISYADSVSNAVLMILPNESIAREFNQGMLERGVILRRTEAFGLPNGIRVTIGTQSEMDHFEQGFRQVWKGLAVNENR